MGIEQEIRVSTVRPNGGVEVSLVGDFDLSTFGALQERLARSDVSDAPRVQVDLTRVSFIDSTTIGLLVATCKTVRSAGGAFSMSCSDGSVLQVLDILGLVDYFEVQDANSLSDAFS